MPLRVLLLALLLIPTIGFAGENPRPLTFGPADGGPPPSDEDLSVPRDEDVAALDEALRVIFPAGMRDLSPEQKSVEVLRYTVNVLRLKSNGGSATKILREGYAICGGMSHVFRILCRRAGLPSRYIGAFYLRPLMGSHAISEVYYDGKWHLFDPTFGLFFYTHPGYDRKGEVSSFHDLVTDPAGGFPMKAVARPWTGTYGEAERVFGVRPVEPDYLKDVYGTPIVDLYRKYLRETFPIAYGSGDLVSFPVDADLRAGHDLWFGAVDGSASDIVLQALNGTAYVGGHYLGGSFPPGLHTWSVRVPENALLSVTYHAADSSRSDLGFVPLKAVRLLSVTRSPRETRFSVRSIGTEAIFAITCPTGGYSVDAMRIVRP